MAGTIDVVDALRMVRDTGGRLLSSRVVDKLIDDGLINKAASGGYLLTMAGRAILNAEKDGA